VGLSIREFDVSRIEVINVPEGLEYDLLNEVVKVRLRGATHLINRLKPEDILLTVDLSGREVGSFTAKSVLSIRGEEFATVGAVGSHNVSIALKEMEVEVTEG
jgi:hypothetical protein